MSLSFIVYFKEVITLIAEIISVGTELLLGEIVDTNATYVANQLKDRGVRLYHKNVVGDNLKRIRQTILMALERSDLVILGGGLGPTDDDLTREAIAEAVEETPYVDPELLAHLKGLFEARGRVMPESNTKQAWLIPSAVTLPNPIGTAPGWLVRKEGKIIVSLPGPPEEMKRMWHEQVLPRLNFPESFLFHTTLHTQGIGESNIQDMLGELTQAANPSVATYARKTGVDVRVAGSGKNEAEAKEVTKPLLKQVEALLHNYIYGRDEETLGQAVTKLLAERTLALYEGVSAGKVAEQLAGENALLASITSPHKAIAVRYGLTPTTLAAHGEVSAESALELAEGVKERFNSDFGLAVVGDIATGLCYFAVSGAKHQTGSINWGGNPEQIRNRAANGALMLLYRHLKEQA